MIHLPASVRVYLCTAPCDLRRSFDGLHALVSGVMESDAFAGHLFVFANLRRDSREDFVLGCVTNVSKTCRAVLKMGEGLPESTFGSWLQTTRSCCVQKAWW